MFNKNKVIKQTVLLFAALCITDLIAEDSKAYINGSIHTFDEKLTVADSILIKEGIIQLVGSQADVLEKADEFTKIINLQGKMMMPSFHDAHAHPIWNGMDFLQCSLFDLLSINSLLNQLRL